MSTKKLVDRVLAIHRVQDAAADHLEHARNMRMAFSVDIRSDLRDSFELQKDLIADGGLWHLYPSCIARFFFAHVSVTILLALIVLRIGVDLQDRITVGVMRYTDLPTWI
jgi:hypothetical protein